MTKIKAKKAAVRTDGFINAFLSRGVKQYMQNNSFFTEDPLTYELLIKLWSNPLVRKIARLPAQAAMKKGFIIQGDEENNDILQAVDAMHAKSKFIEALTWGRYFGRSCIFMLMDDGRLEDEPVDYGRLRSIKDLMVFDAQAIQEDFSGYLINDDINDENYGKPEWYMIIPPQGSQVRYVHHSRLLMFDGELVPEIMRIQRNGVGLSCMDGVVKGLYRADTSQACGINVLERISTSLIKFDGLADVLATEKGDEIVQRRLEVIDLARNILNSIALSTKDEYQVFNVPVSGIDTLLENFEHYLCAQTSIPYSILFGRKQGGLTTSGESDLENYYSFVAGMQEEVLHPPLEKFIRTLQLCSDGPTNGRELENWTIKFNPLWEPTEKERAETEKMKADRDSVVIESVGKLLDRQLMDPSDACKYLAEQLDMPLRSGLLDLGDDDDIEP